VVKTKKHTPPKKNSNQVALLGSGDVMKVAGRPGIPKRFKGAKKKVEGKEKKQNQLNGPRQVWCFGDGRHPE